MSPPQYIDKNSTLRRAKHTKIAFALLASTMASSTGFAQQLTAQNEPAIELEEVTVTGSRIRTSNIVSPIPTQVLGVEEIESAGTVDLNELVEQIPGVTFGLSPATTTLSTQASGLSTISLRDLGSDRTLTLINGRRVISNVGNGERVDTGTIPPAFIERVDITTGGASAVYGSDAIAGVANIILRDTYEGFKADVRVADTEEGGADEQSLDLLWGSDFADGRGNIIIGANYGNREALFASDREYATQTQEIDPVSGEFEPGLSSTLDGGRFENGDAWNNGGVWQNDQDGSVYCLDDGRTPACDDYQEAFDGYNFKPFSNIRPERERAVAMLQARYEFSDNTTGKFLLQHADIETKSVRAAANLNDSSLFGLFGEETNIGDIPSDNPFIHQAVRETLSGTVDWRRRTVEVGLRDRSSDRATTRLSFALEGKFNDNWDWEAYLGYGRFEQNQIKNNELNRQNASFAINLEADPGNPGGFRCIDAGARADGCVPLNVFGVGTITPEMAAYIRHNSVVDQVRNQTTASFSVSGELWETPAGAVQVAAGLDYRDEDQKTRGDAVTNAGLSTTSTLIDFDADFNVAEAFVEFNVPLISDKPGIKSLDLATAFRAADYDTIGSVASWNFGLSYSPNDAVRFRGQLSQAQRAPNLTELFSPIRSDFDPLNDPCDGTTAASTGTIADNCRSEPGIVDTIGILGVFDSEDTSVFAPNVGNTDVKEETADTTTFGVVITPNDKLVVIADYYNIDVDDVISSVETQQVVDFCYNDAVNFESSIFCRVITRANDGTISRVLNQVENLNRLTSEGIDLTLRYRFSDQLSFKLLHTHILTFEEEFNGPDGIEVDQFVGEVGNSEDETRLTVTWEPSDSWRIRYRMNYQSSAIDDNSANPSNAIAGTRFRSADFHDIYLAYTFKGDHNTRLYAGINNLTDDTGPYIPDGFVSGENYNRSTAYDVLGRRFYAGVSFNW